MKTEYVDKLYNDFNVKVETVLKYLQILEKDTKESTKDIIEFIKLYENLYTALASSKQQVTVPSDTQFAIQSEGNSQPAVDASSIKEISEKIVTETPLIEYNFENILKNLQFTTQAFQNFQTITGTIVKAWEDGLEIIQS
jgi:hypothetical protein